MPLSRRYLAVAAIYLGAFMTTLAFSVVSVALPSIQASMGASLSNLQWVIGAYGLCLSAFMLSAGMLADRFGRKRVWLIGVALFTLGSLICSLAPSIKVLIAGCSVQGVGGALLSPGALSILTQTFPDPHERAHAISGWASFSAIALIVGPLLGGVLVEWLGWASVFFINVPTGLVVIVLGVRGIDESSSPEHAPLDPPGQVLSILFLGALTYGFINVGRQGWGAPHTVVALVVAAVALLLFIAAEATSRRPVLPLNLLFEPTFVTINSASFVLGFSGYASVFLFSIFLQQGYGFTAIETGWGMMPVFLAQTGISMVFGKLVRRYGLFRLMMIGFVLQAVAMFGMVTFSPATPYWQVGFLFVLLGAGFGLAVPASAAAAMANASRERTGIASSMTSAARQGGMTIGVALLGTLMSLRAVASLGKTLDKLGVADPVALADRAVHWHEVPAQGSLSSAAFGDLLEASIAHGFSAAILLGGIFCTGAVLILLAARYRRIWT